MNKVANAVLIIFLSGTALGHGGGLDRCGGHHDRKRGGYHVHNYTKYNACHGASTQRKKRADSEERRTREATAKRNSSRAYSCDNTRVVGGNACFASGNPKHMTIALRPEPGKGTPIRVADDGTGVPVDVLDARTALGISWVRVRTREGKVGWLASNFVKASQ